MLMGMYDHRLEPALIEVGVSDDKVITGREPCKTDLVRISACNRGSHYTT